jgi:hypothetical protein
MSIAYKKAINSTGIPLEVSFKDFLFSQCGDHPKNNLAKFAYIIMKVF